MIFSYMFKVHSFLLISNWLWGLKWQNLRNCQAQKKRSIKQPFYRFNVITKYSSWFPQVQKLNSRTATSVRCQKSKNPKRYSAFMFHNSSVSWKWSYLNSLHELFSDPLTTGKVAPFKFSISLPLSMPVVVGEIFGSKFFFPTMNNLFWESRFLTLLQLTWRKIVGG